MNILNIAYYTFKRHMRDTKTLIMMIVLPIISILILGTALSGAYSPQIGKTAVCYLNEDSGEASEKFNEFLNIKEIKDMLDIKKVTSYEEGVRLIKDRKAVSLIYIQKGYSNSIKEGKKANIIVYQSQYRNFRTSIVKNIIDSFTSGANTVEAAYKVGAGNIVYNSESSIEEVPISIEGTIPRAIDYYSVTMLVMIIMYGSMYGCYMMAEDFLYKTHIRLKSAPVKSYENYIGKGLGTIGALILNIIVIIAVSKYVFKANWGNDIGTVFLICVILSFLSIGLGIMGYELTNDESKMSTVLSFLVPLFTFISGGYAKFSGIEGTWFEKISFLSPNTLAQRAIFNTIYGGTGTSNYIMVMVIVTAMVFLIASIGGRRKEN